MIRMGWNISVCLLTTAVVCTRWQYINPLVYEVHSSTAVCSTSKLVLGRRCDRRMHIYAYVCTYNIMCIIFYIYFWDIYVPRDTLCCTAVYTAYNTYLSLKSSARHFLGVFPRCLHSFPIAENIVTKNKVNMWAGCEVRRSTAQSATGWCNHRVTTT